MFFLKMFVTSILRLSNSINLFWLLELNDGFSGAGLQCLSVMMAVLAGWDPTSAFLHPSITSFTAWTAA